MASVLPVYLPSQSENTNSDIRSKNSLILAVFMRYKATNSTNITHNIGNKQSSTTIYSGIMQKAGISICLQSLVRKWIIATN